MTASQTQPASRSTDAVHSLFDEYQEFAEGIVGRYMKKSRVPLQFYQKDQLVTAGLRGLWDAAQKFDSSRGCSFKTYAYRRIIGEVIVEIRSSSGLWGYRAHVKTPGTIHIKVDREHNEEAAPWDRLDENDPHTICENRDLLERIAAVLTPREEVIFKKMLTGKSWPEIQKELREPEYMYWRVRKAALNALNDDAQVTQAVKDIAKEAVERFKGVDRREQMSAYRMLFRWFIGSPHTNTRLYHVYQQSVKWYEKNEE